MYVDQPPHASDRTVSYAGLCVALNHPALSSDTSLLCAAACTSKAWREAVQQCNAGSGEVQLCLKLSLSRLCSFARWLPKHAALVKSITFTAPLGYGTPEVVDNLKWEIHLEAAQLLLQQAMQLSEAPPATAALLTPPPSAALAAARQNTAAAAAAQQQQLQALPRQPTISRIKLIGSTGMLTVLPAHSLTHLDLWGLQGPVDGPALSAALARLSNLQQLHITTSGSTLSAPYSCLAGVAQLTRLTSLEVGGSWSGSEQQLQQSLAQPLPLQVLRLNINGLPPLDLSHLTQLKDFNCQFDLDAVFPSQLQYLALDFVSSDKMLQAVMQLHQLRSLTLKNAAEIGQTDLRRLAQLPALRQLMLHYWYRECAEDVAAAWPHLPQLSELTVAGEGTSRQEWEAITKGIAASTNLTKLELEASCLSDERHGGSLDPDQADAGGEQGTWASPCAKLARLANLRDLSLTSRYGGFHLLPPGDALALTALTGLTRLELEGAGDGVGDEAAAALAGSCQQLCHLDLTNCNLVSMACLGNVRHLTQLTQLRMAHNRQPTQQGLMLLTGLRRLQHLEVVEDAEANDEALQSFWAAVKAQQL